MSNNGSDSMQQGDPKIRAENMRRKAARARLVTDTGTGEKVSIGIDAEIERILSDNTPVKDADSAAILQVDLGIAKGRNTMLVRALQQSLNVMNAYRRMGYGDEVYMDTLCQAIREAERAIALHAETPPPAEREV